MRKKMFTMMAALCSLVMVNAANVNISHSGGYSALKGALNAANSGDIIKVEVGTYFADADELTVKPGVTVIGGFKGGFADANRIYPGAAVDKTEMTVLDGNSLAVNTAATAKHRVATVKGTLEGCLIRNGHIRTGNGGGVLVDGGTVLNCIIKGNVAMNTTTNNAKGGGAYITNNGKLINCVVAFNMANNGYGVAGTGEVINNTITANTYAPTVVAIPATTNFTHFVHWRNPDALPWADNAAAVFDTNAGSINLTISDFGIASTETTTSQYAVFAAAMDLVATSNPTIGSDITLPTVIVSTLTDAVRGDNVGTYLGFTADGSELLFQAGAVEGYGLSLVGSDYIYTAGRANEAMTYVTWYGSLAYSLWIGGSLPTEAQWEYAARYDGNNGVDEDLYAGTNNTAELGDYTWHSANSGSRVREVGKKSPNGAGLYDMIGNVREWCADYINVTTPSGFYPTYTYGSTPKTDPIWNSTSGSSDRAIRGAGWGDVNGLLVLAYRHSRTSTAMFGNFGFRPVIK